MSQPPKEGENPQVGFAPGGAGPPGYPQSSYPSAGYPNPFPQPGYPPAGPVGYPPSGPVNYPPITSQPGYEMQQQVINQPGYAHAVPMITQPSATGWMQLPTVTFPNCPSGLEYLTQIDQLLVHQKVELLEAFTGFETANKYSVKNSLGQKVFYAMEEGNCLTRNCCGPNRPFEMKILDNNAREVIHVSRPYRCNSCWYPCCLQEMDVCAPPGQKVGSIEQAWSICSPKFRIKDAAGETVLRIDGPFCTYSICGDVEFALLSRDGSTEVGKITKQWTGFARETFTDADHFGVTFPMDLDVRIKATLLAATFLIDFMFFEKSGNKETDRAGMLG